MIHHLQQELVDIDAMKAGVKWREKGERSAKYLRQIHEQRSVQQQITTLQPPPMLSTLLSPMDSDDNLPSSDLPTMKIYAHRFYQQLYHADPVAPHQLDEYLDKINFSHKISPNQSSTLTSPITIRSIKEQAGRTTTASSPGEDGLGYPYLLFLFNMSCLEPLIVKLYNDALAGIFPPSWQDICVRLLPKKVISRLSRIGVLYH
jgi:hypothetical protein